MSTNFDEKWHEWLQKIDVFMDDILWAGVKKTEYTTRLPDEITQPMIAELKHFVEKRLMPAIARLRYIRSLVADWTMYELHGLDDGMREVRLRKEASANVCDIWRARPLSLKGKNVKQIQKTKQQQQRDDSDSERLDSTDGANDESDFRIADESKRSGNASQSPRGKGLFS